LNTLLVKPTGMVFLEVDNSTGGPKIAPIKERKQGFDLIDITIYTRITLEFNQAPNTLFVPWHILRREQHEIGALLPAKLRW